MWSLRELREATGLSQAALADRAGVTRQLVATTEAGRHSPSVDAALRLARALGVSVEELCAAPRADWVALPGATPEEGALVVAVRVGEQLVVAPGDDRLVRGSSWGVADGIVEKGRVRLFPGAGDTGVLVLGCDPALGVAEELLAGLGARSLTAVETTSGAAVQALRAGLCHAAVVHGPAVGLPKPPPGVLRLRLGSWQVGLAARGPSAPELEQTLTGGVRLVQREASAASQQALERSAAAVGALLRRGPIGTGHLDVAQRVRVAGGVGLTYEPAAVRLGLRFSPIEQHVVEVWVAERWVDLPGIHALAETLAGRAFRERVLAIGGYDLTGIGTERPAA